MLLSKYRGDQYKSIENSNEVVIHPRITRLVGQNEAGKTALLELLYTMSPLGISKKFSLEDYPRKTFNQYKKVHAEEPHTPVTADFLLEDDELRDIEANFGAGVMTSNIITASKKYDAPHALYQLGVSEAAFVKHFVGNLEMDAEFKAILKKAKTIAELKVEIAKLSEENQALVKGLPDNLRQAVLKRTRIPSFFYFDEYATLPGEISLNALKRFVDNENYDEDDAESLRTAKALIDFAGAEVDEFLERDNYERLKADLEAASNEITDQLRRFWSTNKNLEIRFDLEPVIQNDRLVDTKLHVRVYNTKHRVTVSFKKRSKGFVWFFSFLAAFSSYKQRDEQIILLLDEPGMNLGAVAQRDLMRYFEEELAPHHQIIYSTHSPFMIDVRQLDTVRTVEDEEDAGTKVSNDPHKHTSETLFPLQAALGYDLTQTFFVAPNNLLVEGPADLIYFNLAAQILRSKGRTGLSDEWVIVPVGGADKVASFVSLLGAQGLHLAVFMDIAVGDRQRLGAIMKNKVLLRNNLVTVGSILERPEADIEDLFTPDSYRKLVEHSYGKAFSTKKFASDETGKGQLRIVKRLEAFFEAQGINSGKFNHYKPAFDLMNNPDLQKEVFDDQTLLNFEKAFTALNGLLEANLSPNALASLPAKRFKRERQAELE